LNDLTEPKFWSRAELWVCGAGLVTFAGSSQMK